MFGRILFLLVVLGAFAAMAAAVYWRATSEDAGGGGRGFGGFATAASVVQAEPRVFSDVVEAIGTANANEAVDVTAKISDTISNISFESGDLVRAGDVLVELTDDETAADLEEARATRREARREVDRVRDLADRGVSAQSRLDEAVAALERAEARVAAIEARLADRIIRAPFDGVVGLRAVSPGQLVGPGDVIARLDDVGTIKLDFTVPERFLSAIAPDMRVSARASAYPDKVFEGRIAQIDSRVNPVTRAVTVRALVPNEDGDLRPGMLLTVEVERDRRTNPAVPETAIGRIQDRAYVYAVDETEQGAVARERMVELGRRGNGLVEILAGLDAGERVVAEGIHRVRDGGALNIVEETDLDGRAPGAVPGTASAAIGFGAGVE